MAWANPLPKQPAPWQSPRMADSALPPVLPDATRPAGPLAGLAWVLLGLTAALGFYFGLSALALPFLGAPEAVTGADRWLGPLAGLGQLAAAAALVRAIRRKDMPGAVLAACLILVCGWITLWPAVLRTGLGFGPEARWTSGAALAVPGIAGLGAALARRHPLAGAWVVTLPTLAGVVGVLALAGVIAVNGF